MNLLPLDLENIINEYVRQLNQQEQLQKCIDEINKIEYVIKETNYGYCISERTHRINETEKYTIRFNCSYIALMIETFDENGEIFGNESLFQISNGMFIHSEDTGLFED